MRRLGIVGTLAAVALLGAGCGGSAKSAAKPQVVVSAASSLQAAFTTYGKAFTDAHATFSFARPDLLAQRIATGARPDVYASANTTFPDQLYVQGLVDKPLRFASDELVLATPASDKKIDSLADIEKKGVRVVLGRNSSLIGEETLALLARMPSSQAKAILRNLRAAEPTVAGIVSKLTRGDADVGFLDLTDVLATHGKLRAIHLPGTLSPTVQYSVAIVTGAKHPEQAKAFIYGLLSGAGRDALDHGGFGQPPPV
jgi:molybdate transport system substrate-binding protein